MENQSLEESSDSENEALTLPFSENEALGESSDNGDVIEAWAEAQRLAILEVFGESSDSENDALGESSEMENQSLEESPDNENEALGESSDNGDVTEARAEAQRRAIIEAFGESSDSEDEIEAHPSSCCDAESKRGTHLEAFGESSDSENEALGESSDNENEALGESSDNGDVTEVRAEAQRCAILEAFGESSDSEDEIEAHPSSCCDAESRRRALLEAFGESSDSENEALLALRETSDNQDEVGTSSSSPICGLALALEEVSDGEIRSSDQITEPGEEATSHRWEMVEGIKGLWLCRDFLSAKHQFLLMQAIHREGWFEGSDNNQGMRFGDLPEWATELSRSIWEAVCFAEVVGEETTEDSCMEGACPLPVDILSRVPLFDQLIINVYQPGNMCSCGPDAF